MGSTYVVDSSRYFYSTYIRASSECLITNLIIFYSLRYLQYTHIFITYGWRAGAALSMGFYAWGIFLLLIRGPHCKRYTWFGYEGGLEARKKVVAERKRLKELEEKEREIASSFPLNDERTIEQKASVKHDSGNRGEEKDAASTPMTRISETTENGISV